LRSREARFHPEVERAFFYFMPWIIAAALLLAYEFYAIARGKKTLSRMMWEANADWPFLSTLIGMVIGGLLVHFFWLPAGCDPVRGF
jgi:hypothetical protein